MNYFARYSQGYSDTTDNYYLRVIAESKKEMEQMVKVLLDLSCLDRTERIKEKDESRQKYWMKTGHCIMIYVHYVNNLLRLRVCRPMLFFMMPLWQQYHSSVRVTQTPCSRFRVLASINWSTMETESLKLYERISCPFR